MLFNFALPLFILASAPLPSDAAPSFGNHFSRAHRLAVRHSAGLARDIRVAFREVLATQPTEVPKKVFCTSKSFHRGGRGGGGHGHGNVTYTPVATGATRQPPSATRGFTTITTGSGASSTPAVPAPSSSPGPSLSPSSSADPQPSPSPPVAASPWTLFESHEGNDFYNGWDFFTGGDPTNGIVTYVDEGTGRQSNLLEVNAAGNAVMRVEQTPQVQNTRQSIRITTKSHYNGGLVIMDSIHMPTGCGTWPAFWSNGPNWPVGGEIDIVEGVHDYSNNQATIHTNPGCSIASTDPGKLAISGKLVGGTNCAALQTGNQGCGMRASQSNSFGAAFNNAGGGVYAMRWDETGVSVFFFNRDAIPADIEAGAPQPDSWGMAMAHWPASSCNPFEFFHDHSLIFDTTLCGDWASGVWGASGIPGQEQSCAQRTGFSTCEAFVRARGDALGQAYWEVKSVKIYQKK